MMIYTFQTRLEVNPGMNKYTAYTQETQILVQHVGE